MCRRSCPTKLLAYAGEIRSPVLITPGASHIDLYDQMDKIPFGKIEAFSKENLQ